MPPTYSQPSKARVTVTLRTVSSPFGESSGPAIRTFALPDYGSVQIGRASSNSTKNLRPSTNNALYDCAVISRNHATLSAPHGPAGPVILQDTGSMHGVFVNDKKIDRKEIHACDGIRFGNQITRTEGTHDGVQVQVVSIVRTPDLPNSSQFVRPTPTYRVPSTDSETSASDIVPRPAVKPAPASSMPMPCGSTSHDPLIIGDDFADDVSDEDHISSPNPMADADFEDDEDVISDHASNSDMDEEEEDETQDFDGEELSEEEEDDVENVELELNDAPEAHTAEVKWADYLPEPTSAKQTIFDLRFEPSKPLSAPVVEGPSLASPLTFLPPRTPAARISMPDWANRSYPDYPAYHSFVSDQELQMGVAQNKPDFESHLDKLSFEIDLGKPNFGAHLDKPSFEAQMDKASFENHLDKSTNEEPEAEKEDSVVGDENAVPGVKQPITPAAESVANSLDVHVASEKDETESIISSTFVEDPVNADAGTGIKRKRATNDDGHEETPAASSGQFLLGQPSTEMVEAVRPAKRAKRTKKDFAVGALAGAVGGMVATMGFLMSDWCDQMVQNWPVS